MSPSDARDSTVPYSAPCVRNLLRSMPAERLAAVTPHDFQRWPTQVVLPGRVLADLISNERSARRN